jgi:predicted nucleic acid-binding protein
MYLFDTNILSELRRPKPHGTVLAWIGRISGDQMFVSALSLGEIQRGIELLRANDRQKAAAIEAWADRLSSQSNILPMTGAIFRLSAKLMHQQSDSIYQDAMLAATAITHRLTMVTRNVRDFENFPVPLLNPFENKL